MGAVGLEPTRAYKAQRIFILVQLSLLPLVGFENWTLSLPSALPVRVAPVESLHLPNLPVVIG
jgi:hypothetical protein